MRRSAHRSRGSRGAIGSRNGDAVSCRDATERAGTHPRPWLVRPPRACRPGCAGTQDRRRGTRPALRGARAGGLRAQVALHVHRGARAGRLGRRTGSRSRGGTGAEPGRRRHERSRRRDRGSRGRAHRLDADGRLSGGDSRPDRAAARRQGSAMGPSATRAARARPRRRAGTRHRSRGKAAARDTRRSPGDRASRSHPRHGSPRP